MSCVAMRRYMMKKKIVRAQTLTLSTRLLPSPIQESTRVDEPKVIINMAARNCSGTG